MNTQTYNNPPAFPRTGFRPSQTGGDIDSIRERQGAATEPQNGMTLRDYFAIRFAAAWHWTGQDTEASVAKRAYQRADAMLEERSAQCDR
jgi:hypothetical protein